MTDMTLEELGWRPAFFQSLDLDQDSLEDLARITAVHRDGYEAIAPDGELRLRPMPADVENEARATVGDWIVIDRALERPLRILTRQSLFSRKAAGSANTTQLIAANVDTAFIVSSCNDDFNLPRLERYLALVREAGAFPVIVLTKADLADDAGAFIEAARTITAEMPVEALDARDVEASAGLTAWLGRHQTLALLGSSGVGKTTLLNSLTGRNDAVATIRDDDAKGRHTTRARFMRPLRHGGWAIDLPGMRELGLANATGGLEATFADVLSLADNCRFNDCQHESEPGCAVRTAINAGELDPRRLSRFRKLEREIAHNDATLAERRAKQKDFAKMARSIQSQRWAHRNRS
jgi:ribosome biogenesis GTPase